MINKCAHDGGYIVHYNNNDEVRHMSCQGCGQMWSREEVLAYEKLASRGLPWTASFDRIWAMIRMK